MAQQAILDMLVIGGGINGAGIARDAVGRGLSVIMCEKNDLASATSSASSKLIHGGLRYLEHNEFRLVREALSEREVLLKSAPHIIRPMTFVMPHCKDLRPAWLIRLGLFLYDHMGGRKLLPKSFGVKLGKTPYGHALKDAYKKGFAYSDCWVEDARLVILNALDAKERGAGIFPRTECVALEADPKTNTWIATLHDKLHNQVHEVQVRSVVNAAGPWVEDVLKQFNGSIGQYKTRLVKGSHIIVPRLYGEEHAYILQNEDKRIVFVIPYEKDYTLIGTTDVEYQGDPGKVEIEAEEIEYLCKAVNRYFDQQINEDDVLWSYSGVRPLLDDGDEEAASVTRDYTLDMERLNGAPIMNIYGGKLTTYRKLSEHVVDEMVKVLDKGTEPWTKDATLPGGNLSSIDFDTFFKTFSREFPWMPKDVLYRYGRSYGDRARVILKSTRNLEDLGVDLGDGVYEAEIIYLIKYEWARSIGDILWRRSKLGFHITDETKENIKVLMAKILTGKTAKKEKQDQDNNGEAA